MDYKDMLDILEESNLNNVIESFRNVCCILSAYNITKEVYVSALNEVIHQTIIDCEEINVYGFGWINYFDETELLEEILVYRMKIDEYEFVNLLQKYTDRTNSEIKELVEYHCDIFGEDVENYYKYI